MPSREHQSRMRTMPASPGRLSCTEAMREPKNSESHLRNRHGSFMLFPGSGPNGIAGLIHQPKMHTRQVLSDKAQREQLSARKDRNDGCEERESGNSPTF